jgi:hypothetical protein
MGSWSMEIQKIIQLSCEESVAWAETNLCLTQQLLELGFFTEQN